MRIFSCFTLLLLMISCGRKQYAVKQEGDTMLRIMSYNIHHANPPSRPGIIDIDTIAAVINQQQPDVVFLQEVDVHTRRSKVNEAALLAEKTGMQVYFGKAIDYEGGAYGVAILSRFRLTNGKTRQLPTAAGTGGEPRVLATAQIEVNGKKLILASTHLDAQRSDTNRLLQVKALVALLQEEVHPVLLGGDLNAVPGRNVINILDQHFTRTCYEGCGHTIPVHQPDKTIDFITYKPAGSFRVLSHKVIEEKYASDHLPVVAALQIK